MDLCLGFKDLRWGEEQPLWSPRTLQGNFTVSSTLMGSQIEPFGFRV